MKIDIEKFEKLDTQSHYKVDRLQDYAKYEQYFDSIQFCGVFFDQFGPMKAGGVKGSINESHSTAELSLSIDIGLYKHHKNTYNV
jgi:hypothetical protein